MSAATSAAIELLALKKAADENWYPMGGHGDPVRGVCHDYRNACVNRAAELATALLAAEAENARLLAAVRDAHMALGASGGISEIECACLDCDTPRSPSGETNTSAVPVWEAGGGIGGESGAATVGRAADVPTPPAGEAKTSEGAAIREDAGRAETDTTPRTATPSDASPQSAARWSEEQQNAAAAAWMANDDAGGGNEGTDAMCAEIAKHAHLFTRRTISAAEVERFAYAMGVVEVLRTSNREKAVAGFKAIGIEVTR